MKWYCSVLHMNTVTAGRLNLVGEEVEIHQLAALGISLCTALKGGAATAGTSSPGGTNQPCTAGSIPLLSAFIVGMLGRRRALSGGTPRAMLYIQYSGLSQHCSLLCMLCSSVFLFFLHVSTTSYFIIIPRRLYNKHILLYTRKFYF